MIRPTDAGTTPALAVVECDGGRFRLREPGHGRGVHLSGEGWRETKNACLMSATHQTFDADPQPEAKRIKVLALRYHTHDQVEHHEGETYEVDERQVDNLVANRMVSRAD